MDNAFAFNGLDLGTGAALAGCGLVIVLMMTFAVLAARSLRGQAQENAKAAAERARQDQTMEQRLVELARFQAETSGRPQALGEGLGGRQAELARVLAERLDSVSVE
jgi:DNA recombination protein RmuC